MAVADELTPIPATEIGHKCILIGKSGAELGTKIQVVGVIVVRHPHTGLEIMLEQVDQKPVGENIYLEIKGGPFGENDVGKRVRVVGHEVGELRQIPLLNQVDRSKIGNMGCHLSFMITEALDPKKPTGSNSTNPQSTQGGAGQPVARPESDSQGSQKPQPESEQLAR
ncbi:hypothetical protein OKA04_23520 [Luteolibacter flavescens]|uniref:Uncharacterized protein n=1 Tax=Luteolibacter flavescens TaxID=1859460 RepID=A0ABT3FVX1_9BACT|nr:hypothetical protein [Luteolibacter flavescens]MCW1887727.1 hypothetical protein [Luteolibacter flavescens]